MCMCVRRLQREAEAEAERQRQEEERQRREEEEARELARLQRRMDEEKLRKAIEVTSPSIPTSTKYHRSAPSGAHMLLNNLSLQTNFGFNSPLVRVYRLCNEINELFMRMNLFCASDNLYAKFRNDRLSS